MLVLFVVMNIILSFLNFRCFELNFFICCGIIVFNKLNFWISIELFL